MSKRSVKEDGTITIHGKDGKIKANLPAEGKTPPTSVSTIAKAEKKAKILQLRGETRKAALTIRDLFQKYYDDSQEEYAKAVAIYNEVSKIDPPLPSVNGRPQKEFLRERLQRVIEDNNTVRAKLDKALMDTVKYDVETLKIGDEVYIEWVGYNRREDGTGRHTLSDIMIIDDQMMGYLKKGRLPEIDRDYRGGEWKLIIVKPYEKPRVLSNFP